MIVSLWMVWKSIQQRTGVDKERFSEIFVTRSSAAFKLTRISMVTYPRIKSMTEWPSIEQNTHNPNLNLSASSALCDWQFCWPKCNDDAGEAGHFQKLVFDRLRHFIICIEISLTRTDFGIVLNVFSSCYLNRWFCKFWIYFSKYYQPLGSWSAQISAG